MVSRHVFFNLLEVDLLEVSWSYGLNDRWLITTWSCVVPIQQSEHSLDLALRVLGEELQVLKPIGTILLHFFELTHGLIGAWVASQRPRLKSFLELLILGA